MLSLCINTCRTTPIDPGPIVEKDREEPAIRTELENGPSSISVFRPSPLPPCRVTIHDGGCERGGTVERDRTSSSWLICGFTIIDRRDGIFIFPPSIFFRNEAT